MTIVLPNVFAPGSQKSGSTSLCRYLAVHSDCILSMPPEPAFLSKPSNLTQIADLSEIYPKQTQLPVFQQALRDPKLLGIQMHILLNRDPAKLPDAVLKTNITQLEIRKSPREVLHWASGRSGKPAEAAPVPHKAGPPIRRDRNHVPAPKNIHCLKRQNLKLADYGR